MTVYKRGRIYSYEFTYRGQRHRGTTEMTDRERAEAVESIIRQRLRDQQWGIHTPDRMATPSFHAFAAHYYASQRKRTKRPDFTLSCLRVLLRFFGRPPKTAIPPAAVPRYVKDTAPYHDLRLLDLILEPDWITRFESWMDARGISGARKNHLRSTLSGIYKLAMKPVWRKKTHITVNPIAGIGRDTVRSRQRVLTIDELRRILTHAPYHLRVALAIAIHAPKLREGSILALRFSQHLDPHLTAITVTEHKADAHKPPLVVPLVIYHETWTELLPLRALLMDVKRRNVSDAVVEYRGGPITSIPRAMKNTVQAAGLVYGATKRQGVTFHTVRHSMATLLATVPGMSEKMRAEIMGQSLPTVQRYTHLAAQQQAGGHALIAQLVPVGDLIGVWGTLWGGPDQTSSKLAQIREVPARMKRGTVRRKPRAIKELDTGDR